MSKFFLSILIASSFIYISLSSCKKSSSNYHSRNGTTLKERQGMASAKTSQEWLDRLKLDISNDDFGTYKYATLYAELPPQDQWPAITTKLLEITRNANSYTAFFKDSDNHRSHHSSSSQDRLKLQLFATLLKEDGTDAEPTLRNILKQKSQIPHYNHDQILSNLLLLSKDKKSTIKWFENNIAKPKSNSSGRTTSNKPDWSKAFAINNNDQGIQLLKNAIQKANTDSKASLISKLAEIAHLLDKPELGEEAMVMHQTNIIERKKNSDYIYSYVDEDPLDYLLHTNQLRRLLDLCEKVKQTKSTRTQISHIYTEDDPFIEYRLTALYKLGQTDRFEKEIDALLKKHQTTPNQFLHQLNEKVAENPSLGSLYIDLLTKKNTPDSKTKAYKICSHLLARNQGTDAYYKRLIALNPQAAASFIASLRLYDPFEERPLIWQAEIALANHKIDQADKLIQQAIALDPSDGDHGKFTRMHCYDVFARILEKQGNTEKANFLHEVVISIRQGEAADDYLHAGLTQEATDRYKKALGHFNDAYCLQSRLAKTLMQAGKFEEAIPHFKKAFELMPVSFGPKESHCFGCEGLFDDERVRNLALPTLNAFLEKEPDNPRTPYLLGLLFEEMKKQPEAITAYEKAVELDPHYYNAAVRLKQLISKDPSKFKQTQALNKQLYEIAPYHRKADYIPNPHLLKTYWKQAQNFPPSPLQPNPLTDLGFTELPLSDQQFKEILYNQAYSGYYLDHTNILPLDGWSTRELLQRNRFLNHILK